MTTFRSLLPVIATLTTLVAACSVAPASGGPASGGSAAIASGATPTPTLNPNQLEQLRRSAGASPTPAATSVPPPAASGTVESLAPAPTPSPYAPDLEAMLPSTVQGIPFKHFSAPASLYDIGGDMCSLFCPGEPSRLAKAAGVPVEALTVGVAFPADGTGLRVAVIAIRFDGLDPARSPVDVRLKAGGHTSPAQDGDLVADTTPIRVGSRSATWVLWPPFYDAGQGEYLLSKGNVLYLVVGPAPSKDGAAPEEIRSLIEALP